MTSHGNAGAAAQDDGQFRELSEGKDTVWEKVRIRVLRWRELTVFNIVDNAVEDVAGEKVNI